MCVGLSGLNELQFPLATALSTQCHKVSLLDGGETAAKCEAYTVTLYSNSMKALPLCLSRGKQMGQKQRGRGKRSRGWPKLLCSDQGLNHTFQLTLEDSLTATLSKQS